MWTSIVTRDLQRLDGNASPTTPVGGKGGKRHHASACDEQGPKPAERNLNVQVSQNHDTQLVTGSLVPIPTVNTFPPALNLPPVNQQMQALPESQNQLIEDCGISTNQEMENNFQDGLMNWPTEEGDLAVPFEPIDESENSAPVNTSPTTPVGGKGGKGHRASDYQYTAAEITALYRQQNKLGVPAMRKMMKTIVGELFPNDKFDTIHKCRGFWQNKPVGWPENVPFCDPNNAKDPKLNKTHKPPKMVLAKMMKYCVERYEKMHHLQKYQQPFEYCQVPTPKVHEQLEPEPARQTDYGNLHMQATDYQQPQQVPVYVDTPPNNERTLDQMGGVGVMEEGGPGPSHVMQEDHFNDNFDLVHYVEDPSFANNLEACDEQGPKEVYERNFNVQVSQNHDTQLATGSLVPIPTVNPFPPAPYLPPVNQQMQGLPVSNSGHLATDHTSAPAQFGGGQDNAEDAKPIHVSQDLPFSISTNPEIEDAHEFDEILRDGNIEMVYSSLNQLIEDCGISSNPEMENSFQDSLMNWPAEEGDLALPFEPIDESENSAPVNETCIPTVVIGYPSDAEEDAEEDYMY